MQDLRLVGVHEDVEHLLLTGSDGEHYRLPLDEALRAAARRDRPPLGQLQIEIDGGLRPRDVQALVRAGASAEEVAERAGWSVDKVRKYEGPILAERVHVADQARLVRVRTRGGSGSGAPSLQSRVGQRMRDRGVDPDTSAWDAYRAQESQHWTVVLTFAAGGRQRQASWTYDPVLRHVEATDDEARWLSADEPDPAGPLPGAAARVTDVYDVEAEGGVAATVRRAAAAARTEEPVDLMTAMRQRTTVGRRSGRRRGAAAEPGRREPSPSLPIGPGEPIEPGEPIAEAMPAALTQPPGADDPALPFDDEVVDGVTVVTGEASEASEVGHGADADLGDEPPAELPADQNAPTEDPVVEPAGSEAPSLDDGEPEPTDVAATPSTKRKARTPVPSWDDIMFGAKRD